MTALYFLANALRCYKCKGTTEKCLDENNREVRECTPGKLGDSCFSISYGKFLVMFDR